MSDKNLVFDDMITYETFRQHRAMKNLLYLISFLDFLIHYILVVEMGIFEQIYQLFKTIPLDSPPAIPLCQLPIQQYLPFNLSQFNFYILYLSILTLLVSTEAIRRSSLIHYRIYILIKFLLVIISFCLCIINTSANFKNNFIHTPILLEQITIDNGSTLINIDTCLTYTREKLAYYILIIFNGLIFFISIECSKILSSLQSIDLNHHHHHHQDNIHSSSSTFIKM